MLFFLFVTICYFFFFRNNIRNEDYFESGNEHVLFTFFFFSVRTRREYRNYFYRANEGERSTARSSNVVCWWNRFELETGTWDVR